MCAKLLLVQPTEFEEKAVKKVDDLLESYMGIRDTELGEHHAHRFFSDISSTNNTTCFSVNARFTAWDLSASETLLFT